MDSTYAPQSPDLSSFLSTPPKGQPQHPHPQHHQPYYSTSSSSSYTPRSPVIPASFGTTSASQPQSRLQHQNLDPNDGDFGLRGPSAGLVGSLNGNGTRHQYMPPIPSLPASHCFPPPPTSPTLTSHPVQSEAYSYPGGPQFAHPQLHPQQRLQQPIKPDPTQRFKRVYQDDEDLPPSAMSSRTPRQRKNASSTNPLAAPPTFTGVVEPVLPVRNPNPNAITITHKFPAARIKRIMQADEEVGKVAQVTPVAVGKALELFMIGLVSAAAEKAKESGGKRVGAGHLKSVVLGDERWDFLGEIVNKVNDDKEGDSKGKKKGVAGSDDEEDVDDGEKKKKGKGGKKKKSDD